MQKHRVRFHDPEEQDPRLLAVALLHQPYGELHSCPITRARLIVRTSRTKAKAKESLALYFERSVRELDEKRKAVGSALALVQARGRILEPIFEHKLRLASPFEVVFN